MTEYEFMRPDPPRASELGRFPVPIHDLWGADVHRCKRPGEAAQAPATARKGFTSFQMQNR